MTLATLTRRLFNTQWITSQLEQEDIFSLESSKIFTQWLYDDNKQYYCYL